MGSEHQVWLPLHAGPRPQLQPALVAAFHHRAGPPGPLPLERPGFGQRPAEYVTALGETDTPGGWRENKKDGGILMDVPGNKILLRGLSMPHSPRLYQDRLWVLESGEGSLAWVDLQEGTWHTVAKLPGFTRGIDFVGPLAFIGLSQVRESAVFSGIPLVERLEERTCGVWVVNIQTGETVGFLRFESGVQEIFAVQVVPARFPEMMEWGNKLLMTSYVLPDKALKHVPQTMREAQSAEKASG